MKEHSASGEAGDGQDEVRHHELGLEVEGRKNLDWPTRQQSRRAALQRIATRLRAMPRGAPSGARATIDETDPRAIKMDTFQAAVNVDFSGVLTHVNSDTLADRPATSQPTIRESTRLGRFIGSLQRQVYRFRVRKN